MTERDGSGEMQQEKTPKEKKIARKRAYRHRKVKLKSALLEGKTYKDAMIEAGYSLHTAASASRKTVLRQALEEIERDFRLSNITVESVLKDVQVGKDKAFEKGDLGNFFRGVELEGKYLSMFKEAQTQVNVVIGDGINTRLTSLLKPISTTPLNTIPYKKEEHERS